MFGHSFGGFLTLEAALAGSAFERIALYEPGVSIDGSIPSAGPTRAGASSMPASPQKRS
ncbi:hypothetical protein [Streptomyces bobili]|uniref:hypothetical protein n=1 Tax=Streptomyces bobili TaxID=67280 RepID=UPI0037F75D5E